VVQTGWSVSRLRWASHVTGNSARHHVTSSLRHDTVAWLIADLTSQLSSSLATTTTTTTAATTTTSTTTSTSTLVASYLYATIVAIFTAVTSRSFRFLLHVSFHFKFFFSLFFVRLLLLLLLLLIIIIIISRYWIHVSLILCKVIMEIFGDYWTWPDVWHQSVKSLKANSLPWLTELLIKTLVNT